MGTLLVGTAGWTDRTLIDSGWYPPGIDTPAKRLEFYADTFPLVEVDATYYSPVSERVAALWTQRTPQHFTFNIKAFSLFTQHPTKPSALPKDLRSAADNIDRPNVYLHDLTPHAVDELWERFLGALTPLHEAGKLGAILLQFPPWFPIDLEVLGACGRARHHTMSNTAPPSSAGSAPPCRNKIVLQGSHLCRTFHRTGLREIRWRPTGDGRATSTDESPVSTWSMARTRSRKCACPIHSVRTRRKRPRYWAGGWPTSMSAKAILSCSCTAIRRRRTYGAT